MSVSLNNLRPAGGSTHRPKRVGRGNASGHGTYSTRGMKGQKSRSGVSNLKRLGLKKMLLSVPKTRGFKSLQAKNAAVNLSDLNGFKPGAIISAKTLTAAGLVKKADMRVKILAKGKLTVEGLVFSHVLMSTVAVEAIKQAKGVIKN